MARSKFLFPMDTDAAPEKGLADERKLVTRKTGWETLNGEIVNRLEKMI